MLIGATTENPRFEVNSALLSRVTVYELEALSEDDVAELLRRAHARGEIGDVALDAEAVDLLARRSGRRRAHRPERAPTRAAGRGSPTTSMSAPRARRSRPGWSAMHRAGDQHYDTISAWIKATRGSDPDASLYYLATMLEGGEDPRFIARRMVILASEDIGNADPEALVVAVAAAAAVSSIIGAAGVLLRARAGGDPPVARAEVRRGRARAQRRPRADPPRGSSPCARRAARRRRVRQSARPFGAHQRAGAGCPTGSRGPLLRTRRSRGRASPRRWRACARRREGARERHARTRTCRGRPPDCGVRSRVPDRARYSSSARRRR